MNTKRATLSHKTSNSWQHQILDLRKLTSLYWSFNIRISSKVKIQEQKRS